jgi:alkanesulfonate monooxygenase SsuD/methylene tetrahydromethanopterin reductase-like flavin-dependent oxidoreductase (luciferase family)
VEHHGRHYVVDGARLAPLPLRPVPFWIGGNGPRALRRAARWDGWLADGSDPERNWLAPEDVAAKLAPLELRPSFDVAFIGYAAGADLAAYAAAGVTWWIENVHGEPNAVVEQLRAGPPGETLP